MMYTFTKAKAPRACTLSGLGSIRAMPSESNYGIMRQICDDGRNEVQGIPALAVACGCTLLWILAKLPVHAPCLNWSRFGRSGQKANTASCVYTAMIEGMRYKVYLLLQGLGVACGLSLIHI